MWRRQRRLWWTSGETLLTTPHWPSTPRLWRESAALNSWGCTSQRTSPGLPTPSLSPRRHNSAYTFSAGWKEQASLHPSSPPSTAVPLRACVLTSCITVWYGNSCAADRKTLQRTVNTAAKIIGAPLPSILDIFLTRCSSKAKSIVEDPTHPPTVSSSSYPQVDGTGVSEPAPPDCSTAFSPRLWEPWTQITPPLSETPNNPPTPPTLPHLREKLLTFISVEFRWAGLHKPPVATHSPLHALDTFTHHCVSIISQKTDCNIWL